jgi:transcriptional regulator with XRE-family HTH domain
MDLTIVSRIRTAAGLTQAELARRAGTSQSSIARLEAGAASPTLNTLERLARAAGVSLDIRVAPVPVADPVVEAYKRDVDRSLLRENMTRSVDERLRALMEMHAAAQELRRATRVAR